MTAMPWSNTVDVVSIPGSAVKAMLEHSASQYDADHPDPSGRFLQVRTIFLLTRKALSIWQPSLGQPHGFVCNTYYNLFNIFSVGGQGTQANYDYEEKQA